MHPSSKLFGIYIHWPYCLSKCPYCDFYSVVCPRPDYTEMLAAYKRDILFFKQKLADTPIVTSLFFGGGTPSLMPIGFFGELMDFLKSQFVLSDSVEITMEANPDAIDLKKMISLQKAGVNRLSVGIQALSPDALTRLGRRHTVETAYQRLKEAKKVFQEINADFIYTRPNQTLAEWEEELGNILELDLTHYSLYQLSIEENTPFGRQKIAVPEEEESARFYLRTNHIMAQAGFPPYEISNYARDNHRCRHNLTYWRGEDYLGIGPAAHGRIGFWATQNPSSTKEWLATKPHCEKLSEAEKREERIIMGLRLMREGFPTALLNPNGVEKAIRYEWGKVKNALFYPTENGFLALNRLILMLLPEEE